MSEERKRPEEFSPIALYGDIETFQGMLDKGFTQVTFCSGEREVDDGRIVAAWAFIHPGNDRVAIYGTRKSYAFGSSVRERFEQEFINQDEFQKFCRDNNVRVGPATNLGELLVRWA